MVAEKRLMLYKINYYICPFPQGTWTSATNGPKPPPLPTRRHLQRHNMSPQLQQLRSTRHGALQNRGQTTAGRTSTTLSTRTRTSSKKRKQNRRMSLATCWAAKGTSSAAKGTTRQGPSIRCEKKKWLGKWILRSWRWWNGWVSKKLCFLWRCYRILFTERGKEKQHPCIALFTSRGSLGRSQVEQMWNAPVSFADGCEESLQKGMLGCSSR